MNNTKSFVNAVLLSLHLTVLASAVSASECAFSLTGQRFCPWRLPFNKNSLRFAFSNSFAKTSSSGSPRISHVCMQNNPPKPMDKYRFEDIRVGNQNIGKTKLAWPSLRPGQFRHPLDSSATLAIQRLFPFENLVRQSMGGMIEQIVFLDNLSNSIRVGSSQLPAIFQRLDFVEWFQL